ncbi:hypothetical protein BDP27DRAFT_1071989 [Rhodocollybia butyracea]|uniref:Secreted protein n=1 Tax=Rhodocollybia butyracea TaxID=206335 RepID=A0A9P5PM69_9AGAR|nr:hypothetical protein BDP27DRAFT_1071989 [Rhodocollybia butyracea]
MFSSPCQASSLPTRILVFLHLRLATTSQVLAWIFDGRQSLFHLRFWIQGILKIGLRGQKNVVRKYYSRSIFLRSSVPLPSLSFSSSDNLAIMIATLRTRLSPSQPC